MSGPDALLRELAGRCAAALPGRLLGAYLEGSGAYYTALATSDLDGTIIVRGTLSSAERATLAMIVARFGRSTPVEIYRGYLLAELRGDDEAGRALARRALEEIPLAD